MNQVLSPRPTRRSAMEARKESAEARSCFPARSEKVLSRRRSISNPDEVLLGGVLSVHTSVPGGISNPKVPPCSDPRLPEAPPGDFSSSASSQEGARGLAAQTSTHSVRYVCWVLGLPGPTRGFLLGFLWVSVTVNILGSGQLGDTGK